MCNLYTQSKSVDEIAALFRSQQMPLVFPEGVPNLQPKDIAITDPGPVVRAGGDAQYEMIVRRWSWPDAGGRPVYNFRSEGREFNSGRCLIVADGFYEYTAPADPGRKRKDRWLFTMPGEDWFAIAGIVRDHPGVGEAFTMLTAAPGPDVAPYHGRQVVVLTRAQWPLWLDLRIPAGDVLAPSPAGTLAVEPA